MIKCEEMIEGIGFTYDPRCDDAPPSYDFCRRMVAERAYWEWEQSGCPFDAMELDRWIKAEAELFSGFRGDGYDIYVCNMSLRENQGFFRHYDIFHVSPNGVQKIILRSK